MTQVLSETELRTISVTLSKELAQLIEEEFAPKACEIAPKWKGGKLLLQSGNDTQNKEFPIDIFFKKILTVRDCLRLIEQKIGATESLDTEEKASVQSYISRAYGTLTSFNILFRDDKDKFVGQGKLKEEPAPKKGLPRSPLNEF